MAWSVNREGFGPGIEQTSDFNKNSFLAKTATVVPGRSLEEDQRHSTSSMEHG